MPDRQLEPVGERRNRALPVDRDSAGNVEVWALGKDRFRITAPGYEQLVTGIEEARG